MKDFERVLSLMFFLLGIISMHLSVTETVPFMLMAIYLLMLSNKHEHKP